MQLAACSKNAFLCNLSCNSDLHAKGFSQREASGFAVFFSFFRYEFPAVFRKTFRYTLTAFLVFIFAAAFAAAASLLDEGFADRVAPRLRHDIAGHRNWTEDINRANPLASTSIQR